MNVSSVKNLNGEVLSAVQDASLTNVVQTNSGNWQDITAYQNASGTYITEISIPESANWNETSNVVQTNSAQWAEGGVLTGDYVSGVNLVKEPYEEGGVRGRFCSANVSGDVTVTVGEYDGTSYYDHATYSLTSLGEQVEDKLNKYFITASETLKNKDSKYEVFGKSYRYAGTATASADSVGIDDNGSCFISFKTSYNNYLKNATIILEYNTVGFVDPTVWNIVSNENNSATLTKSYRNDYLTRDHIKFEDWDGWNVTNCDATCTTYSALELAELAFKDEIPSGGNTEVESYVVTNSASIDDTINNVTTNSGAWNEVSTTVQTNSAKWGQGGGDTFYIYPGKTTDKEISENSGKDLKLYNSANNVFLDFAGKSTLQKYTMFSFKEITGTQSHQNTLQHLRLRVYPNATSACKVFDSEAVDLLNRDSTVSYATTAYFDAGGRDLAQTHDDLTALNSFVQSNSAKWGQGGSTPASESVLFKLYESNDPNNGSYSKNSFVSGATDLYFEASVPVDSDIPSDIVLIHNGSEVGRACWSHVSSEGSYNYYTASYNNSYDEELEIQCNLLSYEYFNVSANGVKTNALSQHEYLISDTSNSVKFNIVGDNIAGTIDVYQDGIGHTLLTSFNGNLTDFTAKGYERYVTNVNSEDPNFGYNYNLIAELVGGGGGSSVASGDVFPPTNNLVPQTTYYLGWNANNGGLFWYDAGNGGN